MGERADRMSPSHVGSKARSAAARKATADNAGQMARQTRDTAQSVRGGLLTATARNPVPIMCATIGIGWLWTRRSSSGGSSARASSSMHGIERERQDQSGGQPQEMAGQLQHQPQEQAGQMRQQAQGLWQMVDANPLAAGALGLVLGGIAGLIIPETDKEHQLMGEARDRAIGRAQERVIGSVQERVQEVAEQAVETAMDKARDVMPRSGSR